MDSIHGFSFLLGAAIAWFIAKQLRKDARSSDDEWLIKDVSAPTDAEVEQALERYRSEMRKRNLNEFSSNDQLENDAAGSQYFRYMRIKRHRDTLRSNGWQQTKRSDS